MLVLGDLSVQGNIKGLRSLAEPLQLAMDNGAKRALIPLESKRSFLEVTGNVVEHVDPIFFGDPKTAAFKALGLNRSSWTALEPRTGGFGGDVEGK
jgi:ATP-dependent Lon protease